jgi:hypothetical protein
VIAGDIGAIVGLLLVILMAGVPAIGAAKHNREWDRNA